MTFFYGHIRINKGILTIIYHFDWRLTEHYLINLLRCENFMSYKKL